MVRTSASINKPFSMLAKQDSLPPLPVPPLQQTMDKYLLAIKPLVDEEDFEYTQDLVKDFLKPNGDGETLHSKLLERAKTEKNWVSFLEIWTDCYIDELVCAEKEHFDWIPEWCEFSYTDC